MLNKKKIIEIIAVIAAAGTGIILANIIKATTPEDTKKIHKAMIWVGGLFLGFMVSGKVQEYTTTELTKLHFSPDWWNVRMNKDTEETVEGESI